MFESIRGRDISDFNKEEMDLVKINAKNLFCRIINIKLKETEDGSKKYFNVLFRITEGKHKGKGFFDKFYDTPASVWRVFMLVSKCGIAQTGVEGNKIIPIDFNFEKDLLGCEVIVDIEVNEKGFVNKSIFRSMDESVTNVPKESNIDDL